MLAIKLSLPLHVVAMLYSAAFVLYYFTCYLLCGRLKEYRLALVILLVNILFSTYTFYWMLSELTLGITMMIVMLAFVNSRTEASSKLLTGLVLVLTIPTIAFAHPLIIFPLAFALVYLVLCKESRLTIKSAALVMSLYIAVLVIKAIFFKEPYEKMSLHGLRNFKTLFPDYFTIHSNITFLLNCLTKYQWLVIFFFITLFLLRRWGKTVKLWLYIAGVIGYIGLINVSYPTPKTHEFYIENLYLPLGVLLGIPFVYDILPELLKKKLANIVVVVFFVSCLVRIYAGHGFYKNRLNWQRSYLATHTGQKLIVDARHLPMDTVLMAWGSPYELWLLSTIEQKKTSSIIFTEKMPEVDDGEGKQGSYVTTWGIYPYELLDKRYFMFHDSTTKYRVIR